MFPFCGGRQKIVPQCRTHVHHNNCFNHQGTLIFALTNLLDFGRSCCRRHCKTGGKFHYAGQTNVLGGSSEHMKLFPLFLPSLPDWADLCGSWGGGGGGGGVRTLPLHRPLSLALQKNGLRFLKPREKTKKTS